MQKERRVHGFISDGYGKRYLIFCLYFVLGDLRGANAYLRWYEKTFSDDMGEPIQKLCTAILLYRSDNVGRHDAPRFEFVIAFHFSYLRRHHEQKPLFRCSSDSYGIDPGRRLRIAPRNTGRVLRHATA